MRKVSFDPVEAVVAEALDKAGIEYSRHSKSGLDFELFDGSNVYIECKRMNSPRIAEQMSRRPLVIAIQGLEAAIWFANMIHRNGD